MSHTVTRADLADKIYEELGISYTESSELVDGVLEELCTALESGEQVKISSFGTFDIRHKAARVGRNPKTKEEVPITPRRVVTFHASNILMKQINPK